jgi:hypothetical protein
MERQAMSETIRTLLLGANIVSESQLDQAAQSARSLNVPLEKAIAMSNVIADSTMKTVLEAEELVRTGRATVDLAVTALRLAWQNSMNIGDALIVLKEVHKKTQTVQTSTSPLTELLLSTGLITNEQLGRAVIKAKDTGMQMGRILVLNRDLSGWVMGAALTAQLLVRDSRITKEQAAQALMTVVRRRVSIEQALFELNLLTEKPGQTVRIGELVLMAGFLTEGEILECLELQLIKEKQFGQILLEQGLVTQDLLEAAVVMQDMVANNTVRAFKAAEALRQVKYRGISVYQAVAELSPGPKTADQNLTPASLLVEAGLISHDELVKICDPGEKSGIKIGRKLLTAKVLSEAMLYSVLRLLSLSSQGYISSEQAITALNKCKSESLTLDETFTKLGWNVPARMQWMWS